MKKRSLHAQLNYCISQCTHIGVSKRADRNNGVDLAPRVYSVQTAENLRDTADNLANYLKSAHSDVCYVKDIKREHIAEWVQSRERHWSNKSLKEHLSRIEKLSAICAKTYGCALDWKIDPPARTRAHTYKRDREVAMSRADLLLLKDDLSSNGHSLNALRAVEISARCGLRVKEVARLRTDCIDLSNKCIHIVEGAKNGKKRDVPIRSKDLEYFRDLKQHANGEYITGGISEDSINKAIRRSLQRLGLADKYKNTSVHSIRKAYASERYAEELKRVKDERKAWEIVQSELGHGERFRPELFRTYIKTGEN